MRLAYFGVHYHSFPLYNRNLIFWSNCEAMRIFIVIGKMANGISRITSTRFNMHAPWLNSRTSIYD